MPGLAYDIDLRRPACVLVAAAMGADPALAKRFDVETWLLAPTDAMRVYAVDDALLAQIVDQTHRTHAALTGATHE